MLTKNVFVTYYHTGILTLFNSRQCCCLLPYIIYHLLGEKINSILSLWSFYKADIYIKTPMLSHNPTLNGFMFEIPHDWYLPEVVEKYNKYLQFKDGPIVDTSAYCNEAFVEFVIPDMEDSPVVQQVPADGISGTTRPDPSKKAAIDSIADKTIRLTYRLNDGFVNWFVFTEMYWKLKERGSKKIYPSFPYIVLDREKNIVFIMNFRGLTFTGLTGLDTKYNQITRDAQTFTATFTYTDFSIDFNIPESNPIIRNV